jgi:adenine-specific DNA-methyltransferase
MKKLDMLTKNNIEDNIDVIAKYFPNCISEKNGVRVINEEILLLELGVDKENYSKEKYHLNWPGKIQSLISANTRSKSTLRPDLKSSKNFEATKNIYIEGDNLEALKIIEETYLGKIKLVYADPPYNTGGDLLYKNNYIDNNKSYMQKSDQVDNEGFLKTTNTETNGKYHSDWLSMMHERIRKARNLLSDDGFFVITIDHYELFNLGNLCDEIFGYSNRVGIVTVFINPKGRQHERFFSASTEYMLVYAKNLDEAVFNSVAIDEKKKEEFDFGDENDKKYRLDDFIRARTSTERSKKPNFWYPIYVSKDLSKITLEKTSNYIEVFPIKNKKEFTWKTIKETFAERNAQGEYQAVEEDGSIVIKNKFYESQVLHNIWHDKKYFSEFNGTNIVKALFDGKNIFPYPKSLYALIDLLKITTNDEDIILDIFSGSATTAHAVMHLNKEENANRRFILIQIPDFTDKDSEAYKAGYKTIAEIGKERIRRAGNKIKNEIVDENLKNIFDDGFKSFVIDSSNFKDVYYTPDNTNQSDLVDIAFNIKEDRTEEDLLFQIFLDWGIDLASTIEEKQIENKKIFIVKDENFIACLHDSLSEKLITELALLKPSKVVFKDSSFKNSSDKINAEQIFKSLSSNTDLRVI